jgi:AcrR family transcriptional regulator
MAVSRLSQDPPDPPTKRQRVPALAPEERRAALIEATIPLLREHGINISTRQIADAAGVAEGTIFGVFKDKASLIEAAVAKAFEPTPIIRALRAIDPAADLRTRLIAAAEILRERGSTQWPLLHVLRQLAMEATRIARVDLFAARHLILYELGVLIEPDAALLRRSPATVARLMFTLVMHPRDGLLDLELLDAEEVVSLILDGLLIRDSTTRDPGELPC